MPKGVDSRGYFPLVLGPRGEAVIVMDCSNAKRVYRVGGYESSEEMQQAWDRIEARCRLSGEPSPLADPALGLRYYRRHRSEYRWAMAAELKDVRDEDVQ